MKPEWKVIIADRGFVYAGRVSRDGDQVLISECQNIARWRGNLGRVAKEGPGPEDIVQEFGTVRVHVLGVLGQIDCNEDAWNAWADHQASGASPRKAKR